MSDLEAQLAFQLRAEGITGFEREAVFVEGRKFRADFLFHETSLGSTPLICEVDGATWSGGRHTTGKGYESDCEKQALAAILGYRYIRLTGAMVRDGRGVDYIKRALQRESEDDTC